MSVTKEVRSRVTARLGKAQEVTAASADEVYLQFAKATHYPTREMKGTETRTWYSPVNGNAIAAMTTFKNYLETEFPDGEIETKKVTMDADTTYLMVMRSDDFGTISTIYAETFAILEVVEF